MLTFRNTNLVFGIASIALIVTDILYDIPLALPITILILLYSLILFYGCYFIHSGFFMNIVCKAETDKKVIALSFDDGPAENYTMQIAQVLKEQDIQATFFCIGNRIEGNEHIVKSLHEQGHLLGNHSYSHHFFFDLYSSGKMLAEMKKMNDAVYQVIALRPKLFRPPYGVMNPNLRAAIIEGEFIPVGWNVRSMDTVAKDSSKLLEKIKQALQPGAVYLFHDTCKITLDVLPAFIKHVKDQGYDIIRMDKMLALQAYE
jgi:peptidoglycan/xylan/chitin deacetylase (PgdA/CDA1 family)